MPVLRTMPFLSRAFPDARLRRAAGRSRRAREGLQSGNGTRGGGRWSRRHHQAHVTPRPPVSFVASASTHQPLSHSAADIYGSTFVEIIGTVNPDRCMQSLGARAPCTSSTAAEQSTFDLLPHWPPLSAHACCAGQLPSPRTLPSKRTLTLPRRVVCAAPCPLHVCSL